MKKKLTPYLLLVPQLLVGAIFIIGLGTGIIQSLGVIPAFGLTEPTFDYYKEITDIVEKIWNDEIILIALGQTATVLAFDLYLKGMRALDVGHIDIEYMWYLSDAKERIHIPGKHTAEMKDIVGTLSDKEEKMYLSQIVVRVV